MEWGEDWSDGVMGFGSSPLLHHSKLNMKTLVDFAIPGVAFFMMLVMGIDLTPEDFKRVFRQPKVILFATFGQFLLLPFLAIVLVQILPIKPYIAAGILLIAACPGGTVSNYYTFLAQANTALSVSLTAVSCVMAFAIMPFVFAGMALFMEELGGIQVPAAAMMAELLKMLLLPILLGMTLRRLKPELKSRYDRLLKRFSMLALVLLLVALVWKSGDVFLSTIGDTLLAGSSFAMLSMLLGIGIGLICRLDTNDLFALLIEFTVRNVAIAIVIAVTVLQNVEFAVFGTAYFLARIPLILGVITIFRFRRRSHLAAQC
ncbi:MAG: hypothetical protein GY801_42360 [bacterium]|nr:hypothetical protein [bacterium]